VELVPAKKVEIHLILYPSCINMELLMKDVRHIRESHQSNRAAQQLIIAPHAMEPFSILNVHK